MNSNKFVKIAEEAIKEGLIPATEDEDINLSGTIDLRCKFSSLSCCSNLVKKETLLVFKIDNITVSYAGYTFDFGEGHIYIRGYHNDEYIEMFASCNNSEHPHAPRGMMCTGKWITEWREAARVKDYGGMIYLMKKALSSYNPNDAHVMLDIFHCECGEPTSGTVECHVCEMYVCNDCVSYCSCGKMMCSNCYSYCSSCSDVLCRNCLNQCKNCGDYLCYYCKNGHEDNVLCSNCLERKGETDEHSELVKF